MSPNLREMFNKWGSDKGRGYYPGVYECLFRRYRHDVKNVLEIGIGTMIPGVHSTMVGFASVGYKPGGSLRGWRDFFENATIYGIDIQPDTQLEDEQRIVTRLCDSRDAARVQELMQGEFPREFDIIIDDGSHYVGDQLATLRNFFPYVKGNGIYLVEDLVGNNFQNILDEVTSICGDNPHFVLGPNNNLFAVVKRG
jgi:cephalosporin hydroxylase